MLYKQEKVKNTALYAVISFCSNPPFPPQTPPASSIDRHLALYIEKKD